MTKTATAQTIRRTGRKIAAGDHLVIDNGERTATVKSTGPAPYGQIAAVLVVDSGPAAGREVCIGLGAGTRYEVIA